MTHWWRSTRALLLVPALVACSGGGGGTDGITHFLSVCADSSDCGPELSCECGVCTRVCEDDTQCDDIATGASCLEAGSSCPGLASSIGGVCSKGCERNADCSEGGEPMTCKAQRCLFVDSVGGLAAATPAGPACESSCDELSCPEGQQPVSPEEDGCCFCSTFDGHCFDGVLLSISAEEAADRVSRGLLEHAAEPSLTQEFIAANPTETGHVACLVEELLSSDTEFVGVKSFYDQWLGIDVLDPPPKEPVPGMAVTLKESSVAEARAFTNYVTLEGDGRLSSLLLASYTFANEDLAALYGVAGVSGTELRRVELPASRRAGLFTQSYLLGAPLVRRGQNLLAMLLCAEIQAPDLLDLPSIEPRDGLTSREILTQETDSGSCTACHQSLNQAGFAFESYDSQGRYQTEMAGLPVDVSGRLSGIAGVNVEFDGAIELLTQLSESTVVQECVARHWLSHFVQRSLNDSERQYASEIAGRARSPEGYNLRSVIALALGNELMLGP